MSRSWPAHGPLMTAHGSLMARSWPLMARSWPTRGPLMAAHGSPMARPRLPRLWLTGFAAPSFAPPLVSAAPRSCDRSDCSSDPTSAHILPRCRSILPSLRQLWLSTSSSSSGRTSLITIGIAARARRTGLAGFAKCATRRSPSLGQAAGIGERAVNLAGAVGRHSPSACSVLVSVASILRAWPASLEGCGARWASTRVGSHKALKGPVVGGSEKAVGEEAVPDHCSEERARRAPCPRHSGPARSGRGDCCIAIA